MTEGRQIVGEIIRQLRGITLEPVDAQQLIAVVEAHTQGASS